MKEIDCIVCGRHNTAVLWEKDGFSYNRCPDCGLVYVNPQPSPRELADYYNKNYMVNKRRYLGRKKKWHEIIKILEKHAIRGKAGRRDILEIGCSYGLFLKIAKDRGFGVKGIEISGSAAEYACRKYGVDVECGDPGIIIEKTAKSFDIACMWHTIEHLNRPDNILLHLKNLLKRDGIIALTTPNVDSLPARKLGMFWEWVNPPKHLFLFNMETISGLLERQGYEVVDIFTREGDYRAFMLSFLTCPVRRKKYLSKIHNTRIMIQKTDTGEDANTGNYWNLRLKEIFGMDFIFRYPYRFKNLGPELFVIAKKADFCGRTRQNFYIHEICAGNNFNGSRKS